MLIFLNSPILSNWGEFKFSHMSPNEAISMWNNAKDEEKLSACGHKATSKFLKQLGFIIDENRVQIKMKKGDKAIILRVKERLKEGIVLSETELNSIDYEFGLLECIDDTP